MNLSSIPDPLTPPATQNTKNGEIEVLRGFAIVFTMVLHFSVLVPDDIYIRKLLSIFNLGTGVDLFLVISGYVITGSIVASFSGGRHSRKSVILSFWIKRVFRLLPAAWTWAIIACFCQLAIVLVTDIDYDVRGIAIRTLAAMGNVMNFYTPHCAANGGGVACILENFVGHYWTLSLEEQFYLIFPLLFFLLPKNWLLCLLTIVILTQFMWQRPFFTYGWYFKTDALCWGILLSLISGYDFYRKLYPRFLSRRILAASLGFLLLFVLPFVAARILGVGYNMKPYGVSVVAMLCAAIVWLASLEQRNFCIGGRYDKVMLYLGSRSYSLYLTHLIVFYTLRDMVSQFDNVLPGQLGPNAYTAFILSTAVILTFVCSELTYRFVEIRFRERGRLIASKLLSINCADKINSSDKLKPPQPRC